MVKTFVLHHLPDTDDLPAAERWFYRFHIPEVLRNRPLSYVSYRALPAPDGAEDYGYFNYKVHENLAPGDEEPPLGLLAMTHEVVPLDVIMVTDPPGYTPPPWATRATYPFLAPRAEFVSTFLLERPSDDWLRDVRPFYL